MRPHSTASSADMKWSRSVSFTTSAIFFPECFARIPLRISYRRSISFAVISMSLALPSAPPHGW